MHAQNWILLAQIHNVCLTFDKGGFIEVVKEELTANWNGHQFAKSAACNLQKLQLKCQENGIHWTPQNLNSHLQIIVFYKLRLKVVWRISEINQQGH